MAVARGSMTGLHAHLLHPDEPALGQELGVVRLVVLAKGAFHRSPGGPLAARRWRSLAVGDPMLDLLPRLISLLDVQEAVLLRLRACEQIGGKGGARVKEESSYNQSHAHAHLHAIMIACTRAYQHPRTVFLRLLLLDGARLLLLDGFPDVPPPLILFLFLPVAGGGGDKEPSTCCKDKGRTRC
jgi:hypothetical protein